MRISYNAVLYWSTDGLPLIGCSINISDLLEYSDVPL